MDAWSAPLLALLFIGVIAGLAAVDRLFGDDDKDDWRMR